MTIKSKTKIEAQLKGKTNPELVQTVVLAKKNTAWNEVASVLTTPGRKAKVANLSEIEACEGDSIVVCGKVLSEGTIAKKKTVIAMKFSSKAKEKLEKAGCETLTIKEAIEKNKEAKGVTILRK